MASAVSTIFLINALLDLVLRLLGELANLGETPAEEAARLLELKARLEQAKKDVAAYKVTY